MTSSPNFGISLNTLRSLATTQSFKRGEDYYRQGAIANPIRIGPRLQADCWGSERYHVSITLGQNGLADSACTCPYDLGGICKHRVALVLAHLRSPEDFTVIEDLGALLSKKSQEELVTLVDAIAIAHPEVAPTIIQQTQPEATKTQTANPQPLIQLGSYRNELKHILKKAWQGSGDYHYDRTIAEQLRQFTNASQRLQQQNDWVNCGRLCTMLIEEMNTAYDDVLLEMDHDGYIADTVNHWLEALQTCFTHITPDRVDPILREGWLQMVLQTYLKDLELGGIDYGWASQEILLDVTTDEEWEMIEAEVRSRLTTVAQQKRNTFSRQWNQEALVGLLQARRTADGNAQAAQALVKDLGTPEQKVWVWLEEKDFAAVMETMGSLLKNIWLVGQVADALIAVNQTSRAVQLVQDAQAAHSSHHHLQWLSKHYQQEHNWSAALEVQMVYVKQDNFASTTSYQKLRQIAQELHCWPETRSQLLDFFRKQKKHQTLLTIAQFEQEWDEAIRIYERDLHTRERVSVRHTLAKSLASQRPSYAIALYEELVEQAIKQRGRMAYAEAATYVVKMQALYKQTQRPEAGDAYTKQLRQTYKRLPALQDELNKALGT